MQRYMRVIGWLCVCAMLLFCAPALANAGPAYWAGYPGAETLCVQENSLIDVLQEQLTFDFHEGKMNDFAPLGQVTATYKMQNSSDEGASVAMAFPFIESLRSLDLNNIEIKAGEQSLSYQLYIGKGENANSELVKYRFGDILDAVNEEQAAWTLFQKDTSATLLQMTPEKRGEGEVRIKIIFDTPADGTYFLTSGIYAMGQYEDGRVELETWTGGTGGADVLVIGNMPAYRIEAYMEEGGQKADASAYTCEVQTTAPALGDYLLQAAKSAAREDAPFLDVGNMDARMEEQLLNLVASYLEESYRDGETIQAVEEIASAAFSEKHMMVLLYEVEFDAGETLPLSVRYPLSGSMDRQDAKNPVYGFTYLFDPASYWRSFQDLEIVVLMPEQAPTIKSSIPFSQDGERRFVANLQQLPGEPLTFSLSPGEAASPAEGAQTPLLKGISPLMIVLTGVAVLALAFVVVKVYKQRKKQKADQ